MRLLYLVVSAFVIFGSSAYAGEVMCLYPPGLKGEKEYDVLKGVEISAELQVQSDITGNISSPYKCLPSMRVNDGSLQICQPFALTWLSQIVPCYERYCLDGTKVATQYWLQDKRGTLFELEKVAQKDKYLCEPNEMKEVQVIGFRIGKSNSSAYFKRITRYPAKSIAKPSL